MGQAYSDPKRESMPHALPDVEVWCDRVSVVSCTCGDYDVPFDSAHATGEVYCPSCERPAESVEDTDREAWWWWTCLPGCMPDSDAFGPFETEQEALEDARDGREDECIRARIRREEVEPLREALRELLGLLTSHAPWCLANSVLGASETCDCRREAARAALRAADERGK